MVYVTHGNSVDVGNIGGDGGTCYSMLSQMALTIS